jgi:hypothetical protein
MKRLLWSVSLACFLPIVAEMPSQAAGNFDVVAKPSTNLADSKVNGLVANNTANQVNPFVSPESLALSPKVAVVKVAAVNPFGSVSQPVVSAKSAASDNWESPFTTTQLAAKPSKRAAKKPTALKVTPSTPAQADPNAVPAVTPSQPDPNAVPAVTPTQPDLKAVPAITPESPAKAGNNQSLSQNSPTTTDLDRQLGDLNNQKFPVQGSSGQGFGLSPAMSISNPVGFGADGGVAFLSGDYQSRTRLNGRSDAELGIGLGLFDATDAVGLELSYTINSFGNSQGFGSGGFNAKLHKRFGDAAIAIGYNRFANITVGSSPLARTDYPDNSYYAVATQVIRTTEEVDSFLSRIALSAGVGGGQFLPSTTTSTNLQAGGVNVFGSAAFRLAKPISAVVEWTGQDLAAGLSITPFGEGFPLVITPAFRDISGISGESARFVVGVGTAFKF